MKVIYKNKKTGEYITIYKCDFCGSLLSEFVDEEYERIITMAGKMDRMCRECGKEKLAKDG